MAARQKSKNHDTRASIMTRRQFVSALAVSAAASLGYPPLTPTFAASPRKARNSANSQKKIAIVVTEVRRHSHGQHFVDRFLEGYGWQGRHHRPPFEVSLYVDQFPEGDLARDRARRHGVTIYPTIAEALTRGGSKLAVDGVLIIGEHGKYPSNEKGQRLYPRYKFFKQVVKVFEASGRAVPVFNDKHLSTDWKEAQEMVGDSKRLGFAFLAGSSLPVTWRIPPTEMPLGAALEESVCACYGGVDSYDFHGLETAQCMSERRAGGETGVRQIHAARGGKAWDLLAQRAQTKQLLFAALARSFSIRAPAGYTYPTFSLDWFRESCPDAVAYFVEHRDGFRTTMLLLNGLVQDFTYAGRLRGSGKIISCQMHLPMPNRLSSTADFFNPLANHIEHMILTGAAPYPVERTLLTTGMTLFAVESLFRGQVPVETAELKVAYPAPGASLFWRS
jgi:hypothetical protein